MAMFISTTNISYTTAIPEPYTVEIGSDGNVSSESESYGEEVTKKEIEEENKISIYVVFDTLIYILGIMLLFYITIFMVAYLIDKTVAVSDNMFIKLITLGKLDADMLSIPRFALLVVMCSGVGIGFVSGMIRNGIIHLMRAALNLI